MKHYDEEKYDEDEIDDFEADDQDGDLKLQKIREALARENAKAQKMAIKLGPVQSKPAIAVK